MVLEMLNKRVNRMLAFSLDLQRDNRGEGVVFTHAITGLVVAEFDTKESADTALELAANLSRHDGDKKYNLEPDDVVQYKDTMMFTAYATYEGKYYLSAPHHDEDGTPYFVPDHYANGELSPAMKKELSDLDDEEYYSQKQPED